MIKIRGQPREIALGFALGLFVGMSPTMGAQTIIAVFIASLLKWNKISSAVGVWISNPITVPIIYGATYIVGAKIIGINKTDGLPMKLNEMSFTVLLSKGPEILWALTIGGIIIGAVLAVIGYYFCYSAVCRYQDEIKRKLAEQKKKLAQKKEILKQKSAERKLKRLNRKKRRKKKLRAK